MQIYLDYNASSPLAPEVVCAIQPFLDGAYGNPSSLHWAGRSAKVAIEAARTEVADLLGARPEEIVFTGGGTESNNFAIKGAYGTWARQRTTDPNAPARPHFVTSAVEHPAVSLPLQYLRDVHGAELSEVPVNRAGRVDPEEVARAIRPDTLLVSIMHANNEVGVIQPIHDIAKVCRDRQVLFHTDAAQSVGKVPIDVKQLGVDLLSVAGHKLLAPKGIGVLYMRAGVVLEPLLHGAGHESGRRSGTENTPWIVGLGAAAALARKHLEQGGDAEIRRLRDLFEAGLKEIWGEGVVVHGQEVDRLPNTCSASFVGKVGQEVLASLEGVAASTGAACHSGVVELSRVLRAMAVTERVGMGTIRFSLGRYTSRDEIDAVLAALRAAKG
jgi:cysteine desulfurase